MYITNSDNLLIANKFRYVKEHIIYLAHNDTANLALAQDKEYTFDMQSKLNGNNFVVVSNNDGFYTA